MVGGNEIGGEKLSEEAWYYILRQNLIELAAKHSA